MSETCKTCRFSLMGVQGDPYHGICRRYPPTAQVVNRIVSTIWPEVTAEDDDWCGEHSPNPVEVIDR